MRYVYMCVCVFVRSTIRGRAQERWAAFEVNIAHRTAQDVAALYGWPEWIAHRSAAIERSARDIFHTGQLPTAAPMSRRFVGELRAVAVLYEIIGETAVGLLTGE